ncbi:MAG: imelysin family protein [Myxococcota bacterium]
MSMKFMLRLGVCALAVAATAVACGDDDDPETDATPDTEINDLTLLRQVLDTNADIALAAYSDSVTTAEALRTAIMNLNTNPTTANLEAARDAWLVAREPYGQTEVYRFRASPIDDTDYNPANGEDGPEGNINAWPLGEGLIDYVVSGTGFGDAELVASESAVELSGAANIIASTVTIDATLLSNTATAEDERDVIAGYHAIEFLLWGQDINVTGDAAGSTRDNTPGQRPVTDFDPSNCTNGTAVAVDGTPCQRRQTYLMAAVNDLITNLEQVRDGWATGASYRTAFTTVSTVDEGKAKLLEILVGMGTLSEGELGGERMQISLSANSQEDEHSCFADNTHRDIFLNHEGVANSFFGVYAGYDSTLDGSDDVTTRAVNGYGFDDYLSDVGLSSLNSDVAAALNATTTNVTAIDTLARGGTPVDLQIVNASGNDAAAMRDSIVSLNAQSSQIAQIAIQLGVGSATDVVDPDASACDTTNPTVECEE